MRPPLWRREIEVRPFLEAADLAEFMTPKELATSREGTRYDKLADDYVSGAIIPLPPDHRAQDRDQR